MDEDERRIAGMAAETRRLMDLVQLGATQRDLLILHFGTWEQRREVEVRLGIADPDEPLWPEWPGMIEV